MHNLFNHAELVQISSGLTASSTDHEYAAVDTRGYQAVAFIGSIDSSAGSGTLAYAYAQLSASSSAGATAIDVYGSTASLSSDWGGDVGSFGIDVYNPRYRWARLYVDRTAYALLYRARFAAPTQSTAKDIIQVKVAQGASS
jgi:hypothetical protein